MCDLLEQLADVSFGSDEYNTKMRDAENEDHEGKRKNESLWPIMQIVHTRSRWIYDLYYSREAISKELYDWLLKQEYADAKCVSLHMRELGSRLMDEQFDS